MLRNKKILLGVCGSIAAYKAALLTRLLVKEGAEVQVVMTASASDFIGPLTLSTLSKRPALTTFTKDKTDWNNHVDLALWADLIIIAPASLNTISKMAHGLCDNLLLAVYFSAKCPVMVAPAMDLDMYRHRASQEALEKLRSYGNIVINAEHGELASGLIGEGRMAEPEKIVEILIKNFSNEQSRFRNKKVLITAGPTYEPIDPVRFIGNHSSGKMGYAIASCLKEQGAEVTLISGPTALAKPNQGIDMVKVQKAGEMHQVVMERAAEADIIILAAAVADYTPKEVAENKIKKKEGGLTIELVKTVDIAAEVGKVKRKGQIVVGFALETQNEEEHAQKKLAAKNFDFIVLNSLNDKGAGFAHETNKITIIHKDNKIKRFELKTKQEVATDIVKEISDLLS